MPFKRAGWLQPLLCYLVVLHEGFQCPLSGLVGCNLRAGSTVHRYRVFQCPLSGLVGCNCDPPTLHSSRAVSMPFKRAGWLQRSACYTLRKMSTVSMPFKRAGWLQPERRAHHCVRMGFQCPLSGLVGCNTGLGAMARALRSFNAL